MGVQVCSIDKLNFITCFSVYGVKYRYFINMGSEMNFHFIRYLWNELCVFISPSLWRGDIKHAMSLINTVWNENSFQILFITLILITTWTRKNVRKIQIYWVFLPILLRKTRQRRGVTYDVIDELRRLALSKCFPALCHRLIYEIAIFHSINGETCDNIQLWTFHSVNMVWYLLNLTVLTEAEPRSILSNSVNIIPYLLSKMSITVLLYSETISEL